MRLRGVIAFLCVLAVIGAGGYFARKSLGRGTKAQAPVYATAQVTQGTLVADVTGYGSMNASSINALQSPAGGTVDQVLVQAGDQVHSGETLAILSNPQLINEVAAAKVQLQQDTNALAAALGVSPAQALQQAQNDVQVPVVAPQSGRIENLQVSLGGNVTQSAELLELVNDAQVLMDVSLVPYIAARTQVGDSVQVRFSQFSGHVTGTITQLSANPVPDANGGASSTPTLVYPAVITLPNPGLLTPGLAGQVTIETPGGALLSPHQGKITAYGTSSVINSPLAGTVTSLDVVQGDWVNKGQTMLTLGGAAAQTAVAALVAKVENDETTLANDQQEQTNLTVVSHLTGTVGSLNLSVGQTLNPGQYFGEVFNDSVMNLNIQVDELQIANVHSAQAVEITSPGLPGQTFSGRVVNVGTIGTANGGLSEFNVLIRVNNTSALRPGMTADARIVVATVHNALIVPVEAVLQQNNRAVVEVLQNGVPTVVPVTVGLVNSSQAQITKGLTAGETVITGMAGTSLPGVAASGGGSSSSGGAKPAPVNPGGAFAKAGAAVRKG